MILAAHDATVGAAVTGDKLRAVILLLPFRCCCPLDRPPIASYATAVVDLAHVASGHVNVLVRSKLFVLC